MDDSNRDDGFYHPVSPPYTDDPEPNDVQDNLDPTHPATDSSLDATELYDEGRSGAAEAEEPLQPNITLPPKPTTNGPLTSPKKAM